MEGIIRQIHKLLIKNKKTVAVAESCTGGTLSTLLTSISGSSKYFLMGAITYSNKAKTAVLNVSSELIRRNGAVSREVAQQMAVSVRKLSGADFGIGITGIAGPTGKTRQKPTGTVFIAIAGKNITFCRRFRFPGGRAGVRKAAALKALELLKCAHLSL
ncbi:MAG: CinA family protein [Deltaproteobacteria bacterium]